MESKKSKVGVYLRFDFAVLPEAVRIAVISVASFNNDSNLLYGKTPASTISSSQ